jgi:small subunit ribosomal protein S9
MSDKKEQEENSNPFKGRKYIRAVGRRKSAIAIAQLYVRGKGNFVVNKKKVADYFPSGPFTDIATSSIKKIGDNVKFDINVKVTGGGPKGQAEAVRLAVARALLSHDQDIRKTLRVAGYLTVDRRVKERKKPGLKRARRAPQWSKR